jgi:hypothetical protein
MTMTKRISLGALALLVLFTIACVATTQAPVEPKATPAQKVSVTISSEPGNAEVYVDGRFVGTSTMEVRLGPGTYKIEVRRAGFKPWVRDLSVADYPTRATALLERE